MELFKHARPAAGGGVSLLLFLTFVYQLYAGDEPMLNLCSVAGDKGYIRRLRLDTLSIADERYAKLLKAELQRMGPAKALSGAWRRLQNRLDDQRVDG